ncbi:hypothetical protein ABES25_15510 [Bacillus gobiensis]|uniref:hypothetical protein n=2 Tax=Bacillus gobiensis TaxID=1441095 RepID=UPI003D205A7D
MIFIFLFITILTLAIIVNWKVYRLNISTVAGAPIMAVGIMMKDILTEDFALPYISGIVFHLIILIAFWVIIHYTFDMLEGVFYSSHIKDPISSFSTGTWIAAISVITVLLSDKQFYTPSRILFFINLVLWLSYLGLAVRNYIYIFKATKKYSHQIHGGLLLTCVVTQSIVISGYTIFGVAFPTHFADILLIIGFLFYLLNFGLILFRYIHIPNKDLTESWTNTNCIIHGAMSITGVSLTFSHFEAFYILDFIWIVSFTLFLIIEVIEIFRATQRVKKLGWKQGVFSYSPSQWARIFTFGTFLFFTERIPKGHYLLIDSLQNLVFLFLPILIVLLILIEVLLISLQVHQNFTTKDEPIHLPYENSRYSAQ